MEERVTGRRSLWVIEDDESIAQCLRMLLEDEGYAVEVAGTLREARLLQSAPELVLLDFLLPDGNGIAFLPELSQRHPSARVLLLTALDRVGESRFPHHVHYLAKPFHNRELLAAVRSQLASPLNQPS